MVAKKRKSKRQTLQQKYKIIKRTKEHHKRIKKGAILTKGKKKTIDSIPNAWPYKEDLLKEIKAAKEKMEEARIRQKEKRHEELMKRRNGNSGDGMMISDDNDQKSKNSLSRPADNEDDYEDDESDNEGAIELKSSNLGQNSRRAYLRELRKVVTGADVILHVLDARDPLGTRSSAIEEMVLSDHRKKLVYVLNKADLVPREILTGWLAYLRQSSPAFPFKCNTQSQKGNLGRAVGKVTKQQESALQTNQAIGAEELLGLLKNYSRIGDTKTTISVGIVGFPNVGKSSLINSLMRTRSVGVSSMPGFTKVAQEIILDKNIRLIDSPGIVFADGDSSATALRNCVNVEELVDVITPVQAILERCPQSYLMQLYSISKFKAQDCMGFLALVAKATGKLKKGGVPNTDSAARSVLHDWNNGKIKFYCKPPKVTSGMSSESESAIVSSFSSEYDISSLRDVDMRVLDALEAATTATSSSSSDVGGYVAMDAVADVFTVNLSEDADDISTNATISRHHKKSAAAAEESDDDDDDDNNMDEEEEEEVTEKKKTLKKKPPSKGKILPTSLKLKAQSSSMVVEDESVPAKNARKSQKDMKKKQEKDGRRGGKNPASSNDDYDFDVDYYE